MTHRPPCSSDPGDAWHIGAQAVADVAGAQAVGLGAVWLNRDGLARTSGDPEPDHEIQLLTELAHLLLARIRGD